MPRYDSLKSMLAGILRHFLVLDTSPGVTTPQEETVAAVMNSERDEGREREGEVAKKPPLEVRMAQLEHYIEQLPRNMEDRRKLTDHGYSDRLWDQVSVLHRQKFSLGEKVFPFLPPALILSRKLVNVTQKVW